MKIFKIFFEHFSRAQEIFQVVILLLKIKNVFNILTLKYDISVYLDNYLKYNDTIKKTFINYFINLKK